MPNKRPLVRIKPRLLHLGLHYLLACSTTELNQNLMFGTFCECLTWELEACECIKVSKYNHKDSKYEDSLTISGSD